MARERPPLEAKLLVRLTTQDYLRLEAAAEEVGATPAGYARHLILRGLPPAVAVPAATKGPRRSSA